MKYISLLMALVLLLSMTGCSDRVSSQIADLTTPVTAPETTQPAPTETEPAIETAPPTQPETAPATEPETVPATEPETVPATVPQIPAAPQYNNRCPYLLWVDNPDTPIYSGPGFHHSYVGTVRESAYYTIMEEQNDFYGNSWGRLKSGAGWICLTVYSDVPYLENIPHDYIPIYSGPGFHYSFVCEIGEAGVYTIVEEAYDGYGKLWGRLKSGIGWVCLTDCRI